MVEIFDNIRKLYRFCAPVSELSDSIEFFSESSVEEIKRHIPGVPFTVKMFPSWTPTFWFNLGCPYQVVYGSIVHRIKKEMDILVVRDTTIERLNQPSDHIFTVKFFPGLERVLGISQAAMRHQVVELNKILPVRLIDTVRRSSCFEERLQLLQDFFIERLETKKRNEHCVQVVNEAIEEFQCSGLKFKNEMIAAKTFTTSKTISRYFRSVVGTSPKHYFVALRTRNTLAAYLQDRKKFIPDEYGYYDMSHFYKDVVKFTGQRLTAF